MIEMTIQTHESIQPIKSQGALQISQNDSDATFREARQQGLKTSSILEVKESLIFLGNPYLSAKTIQKSHCCSVIYSAL